MNAQHKRGRVWQARVANWALNAVIVAEQTFVASAQNNPGNVPAERLTLPPDPAGRNAAAGQTAFD